MKKVIVTLSFSLLFTTTIFSASIPHCLLLFREAESVINSMSHSERQKLKNHVTTFMNQSENDKASYLYKNNIITCLAIRYPRKIVWDSLYTPRALLEIIEWADENQRRRW